MSNKLKSSTMKSQSLKNKKRKKIHLRYDWRNILFVPVQFPVTYIFMVCSTFPKERENNL